MPTMPTTDPGFTVEICVGIQAKDAYDAWDRIAAILSRPGVQSFFDQLEPEVTAVFDWDGERIL